MNNKRFARAHLAVLASALLSLMLIGPVVSAQAEEQRLRLKVAVTYEQGDFGTASTTRTVFVPFTLQYLGDQFDLGVTVPFLYQETPPNVVAVAGAPEPIRADSGGPGGGGGADEGVATRVTKQTAAGLGDIVVKGRYYLVEDRGPFPEVSPFAKVKLPTADDDKGLGTGELDFGFGVELAKRFGSLTAFGDLGYTFIGDPPGINFRDKISGTVGVAYALTNRLTPSVALEWSRALVATADDPLDAVFGLDYKVTRDISLQYFVTVGLSDGSPDFGVTAATAVRF